MQAFSVLIADSDKQSEKKYQPLLASSHGPQISPTYSQSGEEALAHLANHPTDAVIVTEKLADGSGIDFVQRLQASQYQGTILFFADDESLRAQCIAMGISDYFLQAQLKSPLLPHALYYLRELTQYKHQVNALRQELKINQRTDHLTNLLNRQRFEKEASSCLNRAQESQHKSAVLYIDLDDFKRVNDQSGHEAGDKALIAIAKRLSYVCPKGSLIARFGGDEFIILLHQLQTPMEAGRIARQLLETIQRPIEYETKRYNIQASIGIACHLLANDKIHELMRKADMALYRVKSQQKGEAHFFTEALNTQNKQRLSIEEEINQALQTDQFFLMYHPKYLVDNTQMTGVEALIRWQHPRQGVILPSEFLPIAEESGQITDIGNWVLDKALKQYFSWHSKDLISDTFTLSINLSLLQLSDPNFIQHIGSHFSKVLNKSLLKNIEFELTEEAFTLHQEKLTSLTGLSLQLAIDNFGTGASSLKEINRQHITCLKIDRSHIQQIGLDERAESIIRSIIAIGYELDINVIAEGCEDKEQFEFLKSFRCPSVQGFYLSKPYSAKEMTRRLKAQ